MIFEAIPIRRTVAIRARRGIILDRLVVQTESRRHVVSRNRLVECPGTISPIGTVEDSILIESRAGRLRDRVDLETIRPAPYVRVAWGYVENGVRKLGVSLHGSMTLARARR